MKKILTLAIVGIASFAQALSFDWASAAKISFDGATTIAQSGGITATLIYLGTDTSATVTKTETGFTVSGVEVQTAKTKSTGLATGKGKYSGTFGQALGSEIGTSHFAVGDYFTVLLTYKDESNVQWYNLSSTVYRVPTTADDTTTGLSGTFTHNFDMKEKGTALSAGGGWTAVPEPSTAALALAGLALLLKRRKA